MTRRMRYGWLRYEWLIVGSLLGLMGAPAWAYPLLRPVPPPLQVAQQDSLTRAEVYRLENSVQLLPQGQSAYDASLGDVLVPLDAVKTGAGAIAELLFNEGSIARVDASTTFRFRQGLRRFELPNRIARNETIFVLEDGIALIIVPPNGTGTTIETPEGKVNILATPVAAAHSGAIATKALVAQAQLLSPPQQSSAVMVSHDAATHTTQVFALTDGDITVTNAEGKKSTPLVGGQTVPIANGQVGTVQEFNLEGFYRSVPLAAGLGRGQESVVALQSLPVQATLNQARVETIAAIRRQNRDRQGFNNTFLQEALSGSDQAFTQQRGLSNVVIRNPVVTPGIFRRTGDNTATFTDGNRNVTQIVVDFDDQTISINGNSGRSNDAGLSGNNAVGTVVDGDGRVTRIQIIGVNGEKPPQNQPFRGSLTTGIAPDR
jgi:FecR protein